MKILDEEGMLFGKINIIDFLVLVFILSLTPMFYFGWKVYNKPPPEKPIVINWEQKYNEALANCENRRTQDLQGWQQRYDILQTKIDNFCKEHKRAGICK